MYWDVLSIVAYVKTVENICFLTISTAPNGSEISFQNQKQMLELISQ